MISIATESIYIETPYFVPDGSVLEALSIAAAAGSMSELLFLIVRIIRLFIAQPSIIVAN